MADETTTPDAPAPEAAPAPADVNTLGEPSDPEAEAAEASTDDTPPPQGGDEGEQDTPPEDEPPRRRPSRRDRIIARKSAENADLRAQNATLMAALQQQRSGQPAPGAGPANGDADPMPREQDFSDWGEFSLAQTRWVARQEMRTQEAHRAQAEQEAAYRRATHELDTRWAESHESALDTYDDYEDIYEAVGTSIDAAHAQAIKCASNPAEVVYYLGKNPKELAKFRSLGPADLLVQVGRYEERIEAQRQQRRSQAPKPVQPVRGKQATPPNALSDDLSMKEWQKRRNKQVHGS